LAPHYSEAKQSSDSGSLMMRLSAPLPEKMVRNTIMGALIGVMMGSFRASWLDVPNEFGIRLINQSQTLRLIAGDAILCAVLGNVFTVTMSTMQGFQKREGLAAAFAGSALATFITAGYHTANVKIALQAAITCGAAFTAVQFGNWSLFKSVSTENPPIVGNIPVLALKEEIQEQTTRTRPETIEYEDMPFTNLINPDPRDKFLEEGAWDPPKKKVQKMPEDVWEHWSKSAHSYVLSGGNKY